MLGALRPLGPLPKDEPSELEPLPEPLELDPLPEPLELDAAPVSDEPDFDVLFEEDFSEAEEPDEEEEPEELADSTPSDFAVAESSWPVAFILLAL